MISLNSFLANSLSFLSDKKFCVLTYTLKHKRPPNLSNPKLFNDKLLQLKLTERDPIYKVLVDKYRVRKYIEDKIGIQYLIPLIGVYDNVEEIDFEDLPPQFALKISNGSQHNLICKNKKKINWDHFKPKITTWLNQDFYKRTREWPYKGNKAKIIIEKFMADEKGKLNDYKFWCFQGEPKFVQIDSNRFSCHSRDFYDISFKEKIPLKITYPSSKGELAKPKNYDHMVRIATTLSKGLKFIRVDLYNIEGQIFFGELTFYPGNCNEKILPFKYEEIIGDLL